MKSGRKCFGGKKEEEEEGLVLCSEREKRRGRRVGFGSSVL